MDSENAYREYLGGNDEALGRIIEKHKDSLIFFIMRYVGSFHEAEDIAENTFFKLAVKKPKLKKGYAFSTLLYTVARNEALSALRRKKKIRFESIDEAECEAEEINIEDICLTEERKRAVHGAIEKLPDAYREVIHLSFFEGLKNSEIAKVTKKSHKQVENLLYRAKISLRKELEKEGFDYENSF